MYKKPGVVSRICGDQINDGYNDPVVILYNDPSPIGEGNGNPLQYSCLENPIDRENPGGLQSMGLQRSRTCLSD